MVIESTYRDKGQQFKMDVLGETETEYIVKLQPEYQSQFQEGNKITRLRKSLIGSIYVIKDEEPRQLNMFEMGVL